MGADRGLAAGCRHGARGATALDPPAPYWAWGPLDCHSCHSPNSPKLRRYSILGKDHDPPPAVGADRGLAAGCRHGARGATALDRHGEGRAVSTAEPQAICGVGIRDVGDLEDRVQLSVVRRLGGGDHGEDELRAREGDIPPVELRGRAGGRGGNGACAAEGIPRRSGLSERGDEEGQGRQAEPPSGLARHRRTSLHHSGKFIMISGKALRFPLPFRP